MTETVIVYRPIDRARTPGAVHGFLGAIVKGRPEVSYNTSRTDDKGRKLPDGIELRFGDARPTEQVRKKLKEHGFRFSEKQVLWYAKDTPKARELVDSLEAEEWDIDTTVYEKHSFWALVRSMEEYRNLHGRVEFMVVGPPHWFCDGKKMLEKTHSVMALVNSKRLKFKKFWNKAVEGDDDAEPGEESEGEEINEGDEADDVELLELEAEAELEIMKMEAEQRRRKQILNGPATDRQKLEWLRRKAWKLAEATEVMEFK